jgi:Protein of unknown function (DUF3309)
MRNSAESSGIRYYAFCLPSFPRHAEEPNNAQQRLGFLVADTALAGLLPDKGGARTIICSNERICSERNIPALFAFFSGVGSERGNNMLGTVLIIILILLLIGALPAWPYSSGWGYYPGGGIGLLLIIVVILVLIGRV